MRPLINLIAPTLLGLVLSPAPVAEPLSRLFEQANLAVVVIYTTETVLSGVGFYRREQSGGAPPLGIFVFRNLTIPASTVVRASGDAALVFLATGDVTIDGVLDGGATGPAAGPGGGAGGDVDRVGQGLCPGQPGSGTVVSCPNACASGSGGGGHGGTGGNGGAVNCGVVLLAAGAGGGPCGAIDLIPLTGGSGGAGGSTVVGESRSDPGRGGGGGGAVQVSARGILSIGPAGTITVPGGGGEGCDSAGGSGGGSGGAVLLEAASFVTHASSMVAANGGGGGAGDCS